MSDITSLKAILNELDQLFDREDDINDLFDISKMRREIATNSQQNIRDAKELIKAMTAQVAQKEGEIMAPPLAEHEANIKNILDKENHQKKIDNLIRDIEHKRHNIVKLSDTCVTLQERTQEFKVNSSIADSRTAYAISLYAKISNITWDYNQTNANHLVGCIGSDRRHELRNFDIDTSSKSSFEVVQDLWGMIGAAIDG